MTSYSYQLKSMGSNIQRNVLKGFRKYDLIDMRCMKLDYVEYALRELGLNSMLRSNARHCVYASFFVIVI